MDESFIKLKRKYQRSAIIKSLICGVSFGLFAVGACLLALKLKGIPLNPGFYVLIAIGAAIVSGGLMFLIFNPSDKKVARRLDNEYGLNERAQTALAYRQKDGVIVEMQREDTASKLRSLPKLKFRFSKIWQYCVIVVLAVALALTGILIPSKEVEASGSNSGVYDPPWRISRNEIINVGELIANVKSSHLDEDTKTSVIDVLEKLLTDLQAADKLSVKDGLLYDAFDEVNGIITPLNSYETFARVLEISDQKYLSHAVTRGVIIYKSYKLITYSHAQAFYKEEFELVGNAIAGPLEALRKVFNNDDELSDKIVNNTLAIAAAIKLASGGDKQDEIYLVLDWFINQLMDLQAQLPEDPEPEEPELSADTKAEDGETEEKSEWQYRLDFVFQSFSDRLAAALEIQAYNFAMNKFIVNNLKLIFGLPIDPDDYPLGKYDPEDPTTSTPPTTAPPVVDDPEGPPQLAAKDKIYDPPGSGSGKGKYVTLDEVYYYYLGILQGMLKEGNLTEEQERIVRAYFDMLTDGFRSDN